MLTILIDFQEGVPELHLHRLHLCQQILPVGRFDALVALRGPVLPAAYFQHVRSCICWSRVSHALVIC